MLNLAVYARKLLPTEQELARKTDFFGVMTPPFKSVWPGFRHLCWENFYLVCLRHSKNHEHIQFGDQGANLLLHLSLHKETQEKSKDMKC